MVGSDWAQTNSLQYRTAYRCSGGVYFCAHRLMVYVLYFWLSWRWYLSGVCCLFLLDVIVNDNCDKASDGWTENWRLGKESHSWWDSHLFVSTEMEIREGLGLVGILWTLCCVCMSVSKILCVCVFACVCVLMHHISRFMCRCGHKLLCGDWQLSSVVCLKALRQMEEGWGGW